MRVRPGTRHPAAAGTRPLRVVSSTTTHGADSNPYPSAWTAAVRGAGVEVVQYRRRVALAARCDVFHVHWPESLYARAGRSPSTVLRALTNTAALYWMRARGVRIAWTVHNVQPHPEGSNPLSRALLGLFHRAVDEFWVLSESAAADVEGLARPGARTTLVRHPAYDVAQPGGPPPRTREVVTFGEARPYRGYVELVRLFQERAPQGATLRVVGADRGDAYARELRAAVEAADRVSWLDRRLPDEELEAEVRASAGVVLRYQRVSNSGAALLALSLGRPVLVPDFPVFRELAAEVGEDWVLCSTEDFTADVARLLADRTSGPDLRLRSWPVLGAEVAAACRAAVERPRR